MAKFTLTAQLQLQAASRSNINSALGQMQSALGKGLTVEINVTGAPAAITQLNRIRQQTQQVSSAATEMGAAFGASLRRFAAFAVATRAVSLFTNQLGNSIDRAIEFEHEIARISQTTGDSVTQLKGLVSIINKTAQAFGISGNELAKLSTTLAQAGLNAKDTEIALQALAKTKLSASFGDIAQTTEGVISIMAQFKQGAGALEKQLSSINNVSKKFAVESSDLITVVKTTGGVFKASGGELEDLLALFTSVRATTRESAESIATGLRTIFTRIQRPDTIVNLRRIGVELTDLNGKFVGPYEAVRRLNDALKDVKEGDPRLIRVSEELGGFRQIGKVIPLLQQFAVAERARQAAMEGGNSLTKDAEIAQQTLAVQIARVREEFDALVRSFADTPTFKLFVQSSLSLASALIKITESLKPLLPLLVTFATIKFAQNIGSISASIGAGLRGRVGFASGGLVPGSGNTDSVPAMLTPGEFVIKKKSVESIGANNLQHLNHYAAGGTVADGRSFYGNVTRKSIQLAHPELKLTDNMAGKIVNEMKRLGNEKSPKLQELIKAHERNQPATALANASKSQLTSVKTLHLHDGVVGGLFLQRSKKTTKPHISVNVAPGSLGSGYPNNIEHIEGNIGVGVLRTEASSALKTAMTPHIAKGVQEAAKKAASDLEISPLHFNELEAGKRAIANISMESIEGHVFEALISSLSGAELAGKGATFDFPNITTDQRVRLGQIFEGDIGSKHEEAKRSFSYDSVHGSDNSIANKILSATKNSASHLISPSDYSVYAKGGGVHGSDTVPAMLTPGEFVVTKDAAQKIGYGNLNSINRNGKLSKANPTLHSFHYAAKGFANGGVVGFAAGGAVSNGGDGGGVGKVATLLFAFSGAVGTLTQFIDQTTAAGKALVKFGEIIIAGTTLTYLFSSKMKAAGDFLKKGEAARVTHKDYVDNVLNVRKTDNFNNRDAKIFNQQMIQQIAGKRGESQDAVVKRFETAKSAETAIKALDARIATLTKMIQTVSASGHQPAAMIQQVNTLNKNRLSIQGNLNQSNIDLAPYGNYIGDFLSASKKSAKSIPAVVKSEQFAEALGKDVPLVSKLFGSLGGSISKVIGVMGPWAGIISGIITGLTAVSESLKEFWKNDAEEQIKLGDNQAAMDSYNKSRVDFGGIFDKGSFLSTYFGNPVSTFGKYTDISGYAKAGLNAIGITGANDYLGMGSDAHNSVFNPYATYRWWNDSDKKDKAGRVEIAGRIIEQQNTLSSLTLNSKNMSPEQQAQNLARYSREARKHIDIISQNGGDAADVKAKNQAHTQNLLANLGAVGGKAGSVAELNNIFKPFIDETKADKEELEKLRVVLASAIEAQEELTKANLDAVKTKGLGDSVKLAMDNFTHTLDSNSLNITNTIRTLEAASENPVLGSKALESIPGLRQGFRATFGSAANPATASGAAIEGILGRFETFSTFQKNLAAHGPITLGPKGDDPQAIAHLSKTLQDLAGNDASMSKVIDGIVNKHGDSLFKTGGVEAVIKEILGELKTANVEPLIALVKAQEAAERTLVEVTKRRIAAETQFVEAQKKSIDITLEALGHNHEFGGDIVTPQQKSALLTQRFNIGNDKFGLKGLQGNTGADFIQASTEIKARIAEEEEKRRNRVRSGQTANGEEDLIPGLKAKQQELIDANRAQIQVTKESIEVLRKKNQLEKDAIQKLISGDIEGFINSQAAAAASTVMRSGNTGLLAHFSTASLGEAYNNAQSSGLYTPQQLEHFARPVLGRLGITDQRAIQVAAGTTAEDNAANALGRGQAGALHQLGVDAARMEQMTVTTEKIVVEHAQVVLADATAAVALNQRARGGIIYAFGGAYARGSDTVPAMLTPGEMVVNRGAVGRGGNRNVLEAMNAGSSYNGGISAETAGMLAQSLNGFSEAVNKLSQLQISVKLDATNVNVNLTGGSFLQGMTDKVKSEVLVEVGNKLRSMRFSSDGSPTFSESVV